MSPTNNTPKIPIKITPFNINTDLDGIYNIWTASLPQYPLPKVNLELLLPRRGAHHLIARKQPDSDSDSDADSDSDSPPIAFCLTYPSQSNPLAVSIAVVAVHPDYQRQGIGSTLLTETLKQLKSKSNPNTNPSSDETTKISISIGSTFPRLWPGIPLDLGDGVLPFFKKNGFTLKDSNERSVDLYQDITHFQLRDEYVARAREGGYSFSPLTEEGYAECLRGQERNFAHNADWVAMYHTLNPASHPNSIMTAYTSSGTQVGWTLMLSPTSAILSRNWAMPATISPNTGLIGCVGVDEHYRRKSGVGMALVAHAVEDLKKRGVEGVFVDWVALVGFYERVGFGVWRGGYVEGGIA
ncbi:hypothetical protein BJX70DRAFT_393192 [Aspergillus crustosus]